MKKVTKQEGAFSSAVVWLGDVRFHRITKTCKYVTEEGLSAEEKQEATTVELYLDPKECAAFRNRETQAKPSL